MSKATITLTDNDDGTVGMTIDYNGMKSERSASHAVAETFHGWMQTIAQPQGPAMHIRGDGTIYHDEPAAAGKMQAPPFNRKVPGAPGG